MLKEVDRICKKYELNYWLDFGTLLGAVRHKGFIPWDDDMDIAMLGDDYQRLVEVIDKELEGTPYAFLRVPSQIGKIVHRDFMPTSKEEITEFINWTMQDKLCFALDIFPYYYVKKDLSQKNIQQLMAEAHDAASTIFSTDDSYSAFNTYDKTVRRVGNRIRSIVKTDRIFLGLETQVYQPRVIELDDVFPLTSLSFEDTKFSAPYNFEAYLIDLYRDYMQLPKSPHTHIYIEDLPKEELKYLREVSGRG